MPHPIDQLLTALDDAALLDAVEVAGGFDRAMNLLFDEGFQLQFCGGGAEDIAAVVAVYDRVEARVRKRYGVTSN
jgi:hypothetical protein